jgi:hypothetical protein
LWSSGISSHTAWSSSSCLLVLLTRTWFPLPLPGWFRRGSESTRKRKWEIEPHVGCVLGCHSFQYLPAFVCFLVSSGGCLVNFVQRYEL